uniref:Alpha/beta hydrolase n=1 Tax=Thermosporothrix sp. COM3 TaxID=2490863 RepID=A0A455SRH3_9CHLR|nr:hypothetical protein KTC_25250 [Thermosporothrix sp. COM3]
MGDGAIPVERLAGVTIPTLVLDGSASPASMRDAVRTVAKALPHGQYRSLEGQTHTVSAEALAPVLTAFFRD